MNTTITATAELQKAHEYAQTWAEGGYTEVSRSYWSGMRDALAVMLGYTTEQPRATGPGCDGAAFAMLPGCAPLRP